MSDVIDPAIKYGGGEEGWRTILTNFSSSVGKQEWAEMKLAGAYAQLPSQDGLPDAAKQRLVNVHVQLSSTQEVVSLARQQIFQSFAKLLIP
jgi:hypothetical protein